MILTLARAVLDARHRPGDAPLRKSDIECAARSSQCLGDGGGWHAGHGTRSFLDLTVKMHILFHSSLHENPNANPYPHPSAKEEILRETDTEIPKPKPRLRLLRERQRLRERQGPRTTSTNVSVKNADARAWVRREQAAMR